MSKNDFTSDVQQVFKATIAQQYAVKDITQVSIDSFLRRALAITYSIRSTSQPPTSWLSSPTSTFSSSFQAALMSSGINVTVGALTVIAAPLLSVTNAPTPSPSSSGVSLTIIIVIVGAVVVVVALIIILLLCCYYVKKKEPEKPKEKKTNPEEEYTEIDMDSEQKAPGHVVNQVGIGMNNVPSA